MNRTVWCVGLVAVIACLCRAQEPSPSIEQMRTRLEELRQARDALLFPAWRAINEAERRHKSGQWRHPLDTYLTSVSFPMPPILSDQPTSPLYVEVLQVRRIDAQILRYYPHSQADFPYYEIKARILNTWGGHALDFRIPMENPYHLKTGQEIRLLWVARKPVEEDFKKSEEEIEREGEVQRATQIWEVGKRYLLFGYRGLALDVPHEEREHLLLALNSLFDLKDYERWRQITGIDLPPSDKFLLLVGEYRFHVPSASSAAAIEAYASFPPPSFCSRVSYWVLADPSEELLKLLDEESVVLRFSKEERFQWLTQRLRDPNIPQWKRQRALLYLWDYEDQSDRFLQLLTTLDSPLRAFGLQKFQEEMRRWLPLKLRRMPADPEARKHWVIRVFDMLAQFLEANQPVEVRREAAWVLAGWATDPNHVTDWEKIGVEWAWWQEWANRLKRLSQEDTDEITRLLLDASWRQIASAELSRQMNEVRQQLRALERSRSQ